MEFTRKLATRLAGTLVTGSLILMPATIAEAAAPGAMRYVPSAASATTRSLSAAETQQVAADLETIFSVYMSRDATGRWVAHPEAIKDPSVKVSQIQTLAANLNAAEKSAKTSAKKIASTGTSSAKPDHAFGSAAYLRCVLNYTGFGGIYGLLSGGQTGFMAFLAAKRWADAAWVLIKLVGAGAVRGGVAGLVISLAAAAAWCATPWA